MGSDYVWYDDTRSGTECAVVQCVREPVHVFVVGGVCYLTCCGQHGFCREDPECRPILETPPELLVARDKALMGPSLESDITDER